MGLCLHYPTGGVIYCLLCIQSCTVSTAGLGVCSVTELLWYLVYFIVYNVSCIIYPFEYNVQCQTYPQVLSITECQPY